jgi:GT2 family glycosyltransferase
LPPRVTVIWLNYNSSRFIGVVLRSLESVLSVDYPPDMLELVVVDNASTDGSFESVRGYLEAHRGGVRVKVVRAGSNLGFTGGSNLGFAARDRDSKYVLLLNNDAVIYPDGLRALVDYLEEHPRVAAVQGVVLKLGTRLIDTAGDYVDEMLVSHPFGVEKAYPWILRHPVYVSYADGSCSLYRVEHVLKCVGERLFVGEFFAYGDDNVLGLELWGCGHPSVALEKAVAEHYRSATLGRKRTRRLLAEYYSARNGVALARVSNSRLRGVAPVYRLVKAGLLFLRYKDRLVLRTVADGLRLARLLEARGMVIDVHKAPVIPLTAKAVLGSFVRASLLKKYIDEWVARNYDGVLDAREEPATS